MTESAVIDAKHREPKRYDVTVRTLSGHHIPEEVHDTEKIGALTDRAVKKLVTRSQLTPGDYAMTLPRLTTGAELDPAASLHDAGVVAEDVLVLVSRAPQVDG